MIMCSSDIVVQIVDARNPLLFRCEDLVCNEQLTNLKCLFFFLSLKEKYVNEIDSKKVNMILISKADLLTPKQRWVESAVR